ncbi:hypothetical protein L1987_54613 [Smallanthus sonchifolius]|uniref:Uncharacterized protein n=1 Tax=Smallanthus sonchifolius TaxID=185202 RepID=A0ACB9E7N5_9ASTR|nr:hypothetical protein L1987_54613 [Smallanthus sonchifolius]
MMIRIVSDGCSGDFVVVNSRGEDTLPTNLSLNQSNKILKKLVYQFKTCCPLEQSQENDGAIVREWRPAQNTLREEDNPYEASRSKSTSSIAVKDKSTMFIKQHRRTLEILWTRNVPKHLASSQMQTSTFGRSKGLWAILTEGSWSEAIDELVISYFTFNFQSCVLEHRLSSHN